MKKILSFFLLFVSLYSFTQNPSLFEKRWFVENVSINGTNN